MADANPPPQYAAYPRASAVPYGSPEKLKALGEGYYGLNWAFLINIVLGFVVNYTVSYGGIRYFLVLAPVLLLVIAAITYPSTKKIAFGMGWAPGYAILASLLIGLNAVLCCGIIGYIVMQMIASNEMKRYGLKPGMLGIRKRDWKAAIAAMETAVPPFEPPTDTP